MQDALQGLRKEISSLFKSPSAQALHALTPLFQLALQDCPLTLLGELLELECDSHKRELMREKLPVRELNEKHTYTLELYRVLKRQLMAIAGVKPPLILSSWEEGEGDIEAHAWIDGSVKQDSAGIGVVLRTSTGVHTISERVSASTSHEAETKALLTALHATIPLQIRSLQVWVDAESLIAHIQEIKGQNHAVFSGFQHLRIERTPRVFNQHADFLADLAHMRVL